MDPLKPFEWIWMVVQLATNTVQMVSPCVYKTNGHFWKSKFQMVSNGLSVGGLKKMFMQDCYTKWTFQINTYYKMWFSVQLWKSALNPNYAKRNRNVKSSGSCWSEHTSHLTTDECCCIEHWALSRVSSQLLHRVVIKWNLDLTGVYSSVPI